MVNSWLPVEEIKLSGSGIKMKDMNILVIQS